ncbi:hypothetical protein TPB0596_02770 [Tsukamurella pulmonis]|nr:hypothetical protein TPB0596_02770 [Tsukamurella pulmonis]
MQMLEYTPNGSAKVVIPAPVVGLLAVAGESSGATTSYGATLGVVTTTTGVDGAGGAGAASCPRAPHPLSRPAAAAHAAPRRAPRVRLIASA